MKFTIELAKNGATGSVFAARLGSIASVETPDAKTAVLKLSAPDSALLDTLTQVMMLPEHAHEGHRARHAGQEPVVVEGAGRAPGPTSSRAMSPTNMSSSTPMPTIAAASRSTEHIINRYFANTAAAVAALRAGEISFSYVEADDAASFKGNDAFKVIEGNSFVVNYIGFNQELPLWKDVRVRQAVMHAINRDAIVQSLYGGAAKVANCGYVADQFAGAGHG